MYPPPSGRHAMWCLYGIGRDSWVWDKAITRWLDVHSSHGLGVRSPSVVRPRAGCISRRRLSEIIVVVVAVVGRCWCCCHSAPRRRPTRHPQPHRRSRHACSLLADYERHRHCTLYHHGCSCSYELELNKVPMGNNFWISCRQQRIARRDRGVAK